MQIDTNLSPYCNTTPTTKPYQIHTNWTNLRHLLEHAKRKGFRVGAVDISGEANAIPARSTIPHLAEQWPAVLANATLRLHAVLASKPRLHINNHSLY